MTTCPKSKTSDRFKFEDLYHSKEIKVGVEDDKTVLYHYDAFSYATLVVILGKNIRNEHYDENL